MKFETTEKIDHYLPKVKEFIKDVVMPVEMEILSKEIPEKDRWNLIQNSGLKRSKKQVYRIFSAR